MKLKKLKSDTTQTLNVNAKKEFTVDTSNQMIVSILRDKLYSNKIAAVCREVASNSRDANREAGNTQTPVIISISNEGLLDEGMSISFKDSGVGISPSRIDNVFLKYGSSTKRDSNNQTGGFGIGAKTPFAYTNEFLISTVSEEEGKRLHNVYQAVISNEGGQEVSQLLLVSSNETTENTGTEIIIPIQDRDEAEFVSECLKATILWDVQPELIVGGSNKMKSVKNLIKEEGFKVIYGTYNSDLFDTKQDGLILQIDGIPYSLNISQVGRVDSVIQNHIESSRLLDMRTRYYYENTHRNTVITFETGELTLSASREEIEYTKSNIDKIYEKFQNAENCIVEMIMNDFESIDSTLGKIGIYNFYRNHSNTDNTKWFNLELKGMLQDYFKKYGANKTVEEHSPEYKSYGNLKDMSDRQMDFFLIKSGERFSFSKKNKINGLRPDINTVKNHLFVLKTIGESNAYAKNITLQNKVIKDGKEGVIFMNGLNYLDVGQEQENAFLDLLKETGVEVIEYSEVERAKVQRSYSSTGVKKDVSLGSIYARRMHIGNGWGQYLSSSKLKMEYNKKEKFITDFDFRNEQEKKNVIIPIGGYADLKDLDKVKLSIHSTICKNEAKNINRFKVTPKAEGTEIVEDLEVGYEHTCKLLLSYGYNLIFVRRGDIENVSNDKSVIVGLTKASKDLMKNKNFIKDLVNNSRISTIKEVSSFAKGSYSYDKYFKSELNKKMLLIGGLDINKMKTPMKEIEVNSDSNRLFQGEALAQLSMQLSNKVKGRDFSGYLTQEKIDNTLDSLTKTHPLLHFLHNELEGASSWRCNEYDVVDSKTGETTKRGTDLMLEKVMNLIDKELEKLKK
jgi:hypothetical protein